MTDGIPLAVSVTGGNCNDITQLMPLIGKVPPVRGTPVQQAVQAQGASNPCAGPGRTSARGGPRRAQHRRGGGHDGQSRSDR
jgi:hypothetical protein